VTAEGVRTRDPGPSATAGPRPAGRFSPGRLVALLLVAGLLATGVRVFLVQSFVIPSSSMRPLLGVGDRVLVSRIDDRAGGVRRGDVVVFDAEGGSDAPGQPARSTLAGMGRTLAAALGAPIGETDHVQRVVGLPGERVVCCNAAGRITIDGRPLDEPYLQGRPNAGSVPFDVRVPSGRLFVLGDNRDSSGDSLAHVGDPGGGTVPLDHIVGRVVSIWWPWGRATGIGGSGA